MMQKISVSTLVVALAIIPCAVMAADVMSGSEMDALIGQSGIAFDELASMSLEEIREAFTREDIQVLSAEERSEFRTILKEKFDALSDEEKAQLKEQRQERMANMTPEERDQMMKQRQERIANMTPEERYQMMQMRMQGGFCGGMGGCRGMKRFAN